MLYEVIGETLDLSYSTYTSIVRRFNEKEEIVDRRLSNRRGVFSPRDDRAILKKVKNPHT
jgi:predicted transcriptional regulator